MAPPAIAFSLCVCRFLPHQPYAYRTNDRHIQIELALWAFVWDGENRLTEVRTLRVGNPKAGDKRLTFVYDYMGRRVEKLYEVFTTTWAMQSGHPKQFVCDGCRNELRPFSCLVLLSKLHR